jgi:GntR family transcriptional regulator/MocR family aminotransferase
VAKQLDQLKPGAGSRRSAAERGSLWVLDVDGPEPSDAEQPMFLRIARAISRDIRRGRLARGARLPGSRVLARSLGVHRNTVLAAFRELLAEGWITPQHGRGTYVSSALPERDGKRFGRPRVAAQRAQPLPVAERLGFEFKPAVHPPALRGLDQPLNKNLLRMFGGLPDLREVPHAALARAHRRVLRRAPAALGYGDPAGNPQLRAALAGLLSARRGLGVQADELLVTRGSQMGVALAAATLLAPGDTVAVEALGYQPAWAAFEQVGARILPIPVDAQGLSVPLLAAACQRQPIRAVYVTPHHQYPTTVPMSPGRRLSLLSLAASQRMLIVEDDYDHEFHYEGRPLLPLKSADEAGCVVYVGTLSKVFAPGVRIGYVVAPRPVLREMIARRYYLDRQGDQVMEAALAELIDDGELERHTRRMRRVYQVRREVCAAELHKQLPAALDFDVPNGGMALWARAASDIDVMAWSRAAEQAGVAFQPGQQFRWDGKPSAYLRLGYAGLREEELILAVRRMQQSLKHARKSPGPLRAGLGS